MLDVHGALHDRSTRTFLHEAAQLTREQDLDAVVSGKLLGAISDPFARVGKTLGKAGLAVGSALGNAAIVVGSHVIKAAATQFDSLPGPVKDAASQIGSAAVQVSSTVVDAGEVVADSTVHLGGAILDAAKRSADQGTRLAVQIGAVISHKAQQLGENIGELGPLAVGFAQDAWDQIKEYVSCLTSPHSLCELFIGDQCDCTAGSHVSVKGSDISMRCVFKATAEFTQGFGIRAVPGQAFGGKSKGGMMLLPGEDFAQAYKKAGQVMRSRDAAKELNKKKSTAPTGSCETGLEVAVDGAAQFEPDVAITVLADGTTDVAISGLVRVSMDVLITGEGSCTFRAERRFPNPAKSKVFCKPPFCIAIMMQMVTELVINGVLTGTVEIGNDVDFQVEGRLIVQKNGHAIVRGFKSPEIKHKAGLKWWVESIRMIFMVKPQ